MFVCLGSSSQTKRGGCAFESCQEYETITCDSGTTCKVKHSTIVARAQYHPSTHRVPICPPSLCLVDGRGEQGAGRPMLAAAVLRALFAAALAGATAGYGENGHGRPPLGNGLMDAQLPSCGDVDNCFDCLLQQECTANPFGGDPLCSPCGWCATNETKRSWAADVRGQCVAAPIGLVDFCQLVDRGADRFCPESVCKVGDWGCACKDNVCPAVERLIGIFTLEGLWIVLLLVMAFGVCLATLCVWCACSRSAGPRRQIIIVQQQHVLDEERAGPQLSSLSSASLDRPAQNYSRMD